jgi:hypothetical protein
MIQQIGRGEHGLRRLPDGQLAPIAVEDGSTVRGQHDADRLLLKGDPGEVLGRGRESDGLAADQHEEDDEDEAQEADATVDAAPPGDSPTALGDPGQRAQAAVPAGRGTPSWDARRHQGLWATLARRAPLVTRRNCT